MERRKIQRTGASTFTISLPKAWADSHKVSVGDEMLFTEQENGSLILSLGSQKPESARITRIRADGLNDITIAREMIRYYIAGYDQIIIEQKEPFGAEINRAVFKQVGRLIGLEIVEEEKDRIVIHDFFSPKEFSITKTVKRAMNISFVMIKELAEMIQHTEPGLAKNTADREKMVDNLNFLVRRQINLSLRNHTLMRDLGLTINDCLGYYSIMRQVEEIADIAKQKTLIIMELQKRRLPKDVKARLVELQEETIEVFAEALRNLTGKEISRSHDILDSIQAIAEKKPELSQWLNKKWIENKTDPAISSAVESIVNKTYNTVSRVGHIAEIMMDMGTTRTPKAL
jgi:phosphate transport system protein